MLLEIIAKIGLFLGNPTVLAAFILVGFLNFNEKIFGRALFLLLFTMIYNLYLKSIWQVPLPAPLEGWAFPSGHMHCAFVFWGWLACEYRKKWFTSLVAIILSLVGYGLVYHNYHYPADILGAVGFGSLSLIIYTLLNRMKLFAQSPPLVGFFLTILGLIFFMLIPTEVRKPHLWQALGALIGFSLGWLIQSKRPLQFSITKKCLLLGMGILGAWGLITSLSFLTLEPKTIIFAQFFAVAFWISTVKVALRKLAKNKV